MSAKSIIAEFATLAQKQGSRRSQRTKLRRAGSEMEEHHGYLYHDYYKAAPDGSSDQPAGLDPNRDD